MTSVLVIDDTKIRKDAFREVEKLIKKLERLETNLDTFRREDQRLFSEWINLTFRKNRTQVESLSSELRKLVSFHNGIVGLSKFERISMPAAILKLRAEELRYQNGDAATRAEIEETRRAREAFVMREIEREFEADGDWDDDFGFDDSGDDRDWSGELSRSPEEELLFQKLTGHSDEKLGKLCKSFAGALTLLAQAFELAHGDLERLLILRIWDSCPKRVQERLNKEFCTSNGDSLSSIIDELRAAFNKAESRRESGSNDPDDSAETGGFNENFIGTSGTHRDRDKTPEIIELAKLTYRKLVRALHPDLQSTGTREAGHQTTWQKKTWLQVQAAYKAVDLPALEKLMILVLIRERRLNDLRISEIRKSGDLLLGEVEWLQSEVKNLRSLPAWGFSRKKDLSTLERKIAKDIDMERSIIQHQIDEIKEQHEFLLQLAEIEKLERRRKSPGRRRSDKRPARGRSGSSDGRQQSFF